MRKSGKSKAEETPAKVKSSEESENGEESVDEERPVSPTSSKSTRRSKNASSVDGARNKRKKRDEEEESVAKAEEKSDESDEEDKIPLSKKMKAVKRTPAKNGLAKGKKRAAELELEVKEEYEVESVVGSRLQRGKRQFRIRWKGFNEEDDTWEAEEGLDCTEAIEQYLSTHPEEKADDAPKPARATKKANKKVAKKSDKDAKNGDDSEEDVSKEEYEVDRIKEMHTTKQGKREFLIGWKGFGAKDDTWEPEEHLNCGDLIEKFLVKVNTAKATSEKDLRVNRKPTERFTLAMEGSGRRLSRRGVGKQRARYDDAE